MTKVSRRVLDRNLENYIFSIFLKSVSDVKSYDEVKSFLEDLLSPTEKVMLTKRLAIAIMLSKGYTYDEIDHTLKVSRNTIMNVSYFLRYAKNGGYQKIVKRVVEGQKQEALFDKIEEILVQLTGKKLYGSHAYERKRRIGKELFQRKALREKI